MANADEPLRALTGMSEREYADKVKRPAARIMWSMMCPAIAAFVLGMAFLLLDLWSRVGA